MHKIPEHYTGKENAKKDVIEKIAETRGDIDGVLFCIDNILKYATRMTRKNQLKEDLEKISIYAGRAYRFVEPNLCSRTRNHSEEQVIQYCKTIEFLRGQFGTKFALDYIQGEIIRLSSSAVYYTDETKQTVYKVIGIRLHKIQTLVEVYEALLRDVLAELPEQDEEVVEDEVTNEESVVDESMTLKDLLEVATDTSRLIAENIDKFLNGK